MRHSAHRARYMPSLVDILGLAITAGVSCWLLWAEKQDTATQSIGPCDRCRAEAFALGVFIDDRAKCEGNIHMNMNANILSGRAIEWERQRQSRGATTRTTNGVVVIK